MARPKIRNADHIDSIKVIRDLLRERAPEGSDGFVVNDLDLVLRWFDPGDPVGQFALVECKYEGGKLSPSQSRTWRLMHDTMRAGDPAGRRYLGTFLLTYKVDESGLWVRWFGTAVWYPGDALVQWLGARLWGCPRLYEQPELAAGWVLAPA